ncbi:MAG TPA: hypothetical protein VGE37_02470 [Archangium sp.]|jgi:hypothetical protein
MKKLLLMVTMVGALAGCANENGTPRTYDNNDLELAVGNSARMGCSCRYVMGMDEAYCRAWVKASPDVAKVSFDDATKKVESAAFVSWAATARFIDDKRGCVLE